MENALIIGASGGIGGALCRQLQMRGIAVTGLSRSADGLDVTDEASVRAHLGALTGPFDLVFVATGALVVNGAEPEKAIRAITPKALMDQFAVNAIGPAMVLKHAVPLLHRDRRSVFAALSARVGSIGDNSLGGWHSYRTAKAALNQLMHGASVELRRTHKEAIVACLHPGTVETAFTAKYAGAHKTVPASDAAANLLAVIDRLTPAQSGGFFDYSGKEIPW
jgi:NAD(P)-dependent dehydrogenase (short-subunit alcohol dehydrogenase family)